MSPCWAITKCPYFIIYGKGDQEPLTIHTTSVNIIISEYDLVMVKQVTTSFALMSSHGLSMVTPCKTVQHRSMFCIEISTGLNVTIHLHNIIKMYQLMWPQQMVKHKTKNYKNWWLMTMQVFFSWPCIFMYVCSMIIQHSWKSRQSSVNALLTSFNLLYFFYIEICHRQGYKYEKTILTSLKPTRSFMGAIMLWSSVHHLAHDMAPDW